MRSRRAFAAAMSCLLAIGSAAIAGEPKPGGVFRIYHRDSPGSASIWKIANGFGSWTPKA